MEDFIVVGILFILAVIFSLFVWRIELNDRKKRQENPINFGEPTGWMPMMSLKGDRQHALFTDIPSNHIRRINNKTYISTQAFDYIFKGRAERTHRSA